MKAILFFAAVAVTGCSNYDPDLGPTPYLCGDVEPKCPEDYECVVRGTASVCEATGGGSNMGVDAPPSTFQCAADGMLENNDTTATASETRVGPDTQRTFGPVSICPVGDKDHYQVLVPTGTTKSVELVVERVSGSQVAGAILGMSGNIVAPAIAAGTDMIRACAQLPAGNYFALVNAAPDAQANYKITLRLLEGNCP